MLNTHYTSFPADVGVHAFLQLLEMVGWAYTWDPESETPMALLQVWGGVEVRGVPFELFCLSANLSSHFPLPLPSSFFLNFLAVMHA